jgi:hypothetical protein
MIAVKNDENDVSWFYVEDEDNGHNRWNKLSLQKTTFYKNRYKKIRVAPTNTTYKK